MTKKHFEALAAEIRKIANAESRLEAAHAVAQASKSFNPAFDAARFYKACGVGPK